RLVELDALPVWRTAEPLVLVPVAVFGLRRDQITQRVARLLLGAERQQRAGALHEIARPDEMVAAALVAGVAPGHAEARHHRAGIGLVEMRPQHDRRDDRLLANRVGQVEHRRAALGAARLPALPIGDLLLQDVAEGLDEARYCQGRRRLGAAAEAERQDGAARQL